MSKTKSKEPQPLTYALIESGADLSGFLHHPRAVPAAIKPQKVGVEFPTWVVNALDFEAERIGVPRQSLIKVWIAERLRKRSRKAISLRLPEIHACDIFLPPHRQAGGRAGAA